MTSLTGTAQLVRFILRLHRLRILVWITSIVALMALTAASIKGLYPTQASLDAAAAVAEGNAAALAFNGPAQGLNTYGGEFAFQASAFGMVLVALMSLFMCGSLTRGEEEAGRLELLRSLAVGRYAHITATVIVVSAMNAAVALLTTFSLLAQHFPSAGSVAFGLSFFLVGLLFIGVTALAAQVVESTRTAYGIAGVIVAASYLLRAIGDAGNGTLSWLSPIGWAQKARPFAGERWWPFLILVVAIAATVAATAALSVRRDLGGGLVAPRPGRIAASRGLGRPFGLALRLQRGSVVGWSVGLLVAGIAYGSIAPSIEAFVRNNKVLAEIVARAGGGNLLNSYFATSFRLMALVGTGFVVQSVGRLRGEETSLRAEPVLATPVSRWRWAWSHLAIALAGGVVVLAVSGLATGLSDVAAGGSLGVVPKLLGAALVYAPAVWLVAGLAVALEGLLPRLTVATWMFLAGCLVVGFLGDIITIPAWLRDLSPFEHVPQLPAAHLAVLPLVVLTALAAGLIGAGLLGLRRRDIG